MAAAEPGTTYVTATTRGLTLGAGLEFVDRGTRALRGITGEWQLFEAQLAAGTPRG